MKANAANTGIYKITCIANNKIYVGSSIDVFKRFNEHLSALKLQIHPNNHMQNAYNKYGKDLFVMSVLEYCATHELVEAEQHWLDKLKSYDHTIGFNILRIAHSSVGFKHTEETKEKLRSRVRTPEHRLKLSLSQKGKPNGRKGIKTGPRSIESIKKQSENSKGKVAWNKGLIQTEETKRKISEAGKRRPDKYTSDKKEEVLMFCLAGHTYQTVSNKTDIPVSTCCKIHHKALAEVGLR